MSLKKRLEQLEEQFKSGEQTNPGGGMSSREWELFFHVHENAHRELDGLEALPPLEYTEEDREDDKSTLEETIPAYRNGGGWNTDASRDFLDYWERETMNRMEGNHA